MRASPKLGESGYRAFLAHRLSGLALIAFIPLHFLTLGLAIEGEADLQRAIVWSQQPLVKFAEWGLVVLLTLHLSLGVRLMLIELTPWRGPLPRLIGLAVAISILVGLSFWVLI